MGDLSPSKKKFFSQPGIKGTLHNTKFEIKLD
jgi:hypothetical protein